MKIIIVGGGKVGLTLTEVLCSENHDISLIDPDSEVISYASTIYDILGIVGSGMSKKVLEEAGVKDCDLLIATSDKDELNLLSCIMAHKLGARQCVVRVRDPELVDESVFLRDALGITMMVCPELYGAREISRMLRTPSAIKVESFSKGRIDLAEVKIEEGSVLDNVPLSQLRKKISSNILICAVARRDEVTIPQGDFVLQAGDRIHVTAHPAQLSEFFREIGPTKHRVRNAMIAGGGRLGYYVAKALLEAGISVKIIESDKNRCDELSAAFRKATVIHADATASDELFTEGLPYTDAFVALTGNDEQNIVLSLYAKGLGVSKVVTKLNKMSLKPMSEYVGLDSVVSPSLLACDTLVQHVRSVQNSKGSNISTFYRLVNNRVEAMEFIARENSKVIGIPLSSLGTKPALLIAGIIRNKQVIIPNGSDSIQAGDSVIVVTTNLFLHDLDEILK